MVVNKKTKNCKKICIKALDIFIINTWLNCEDKIIFLYKQKTKLTIRRYFITFSINFVIALKTDCNFTILGI